MTGLNREWIGSTSSGTAEFRHELKSVLHERTAAQLRVALGGLLRADEHAGPDGSYLVRSLYFDDPGERAFRDKLDGVMVRGKFRVRVYDGRTDFARLEYKEKVGSLTRKTVASLGPEERRAAQAGDASPFLGLDDALKRRFGLMLSRGLRPAQLVEYRRTPFLCELGNARVTLDFGLCAPMGLELSGQYPRMPAMEPHMGILEIKYDRFLPLYLKSFLGSHPMAAEAQSKYALCRAAAGSAGVLRPIQ